MTPRLTLQPESLKKAFDGLNAHLAKIKGASLQGLLAAGLIILRDAQKNCPVQTGNLKASGDVVWSGGRVIGPVPIAPGTPPEAVAGLEASQAAFQAETKTMVDARPDSRVVVGFSAYYAVFVHERHPTKGHFLARAVEQNLQAVQDEVAARASKA